MAANGPGFGALGALVGTWIGAKGVNLIALPDPNFKSEPFHLLVRPYTETIVFTGIDGPVLNRGTPENQESGAIRYELSINATDGKKELLHVENGMWLNSDEAAATANVTRMSVIPHGNAVLALGSVTEPTTGGPSIPDSNALPVTKKGQPGSLVKGYTGQYLDENDPVLAGFDKQNPNAWLRKSIEGQNIVSTTTISVSSTEGGGIHNIPYLDANQPNSQNRANATAFKSTFWIETVDSDGSLQLQYSQQINIEFLNNLDNPPDGLVEWPHITVNTLTKQ